MPSSEISELKAFQMCEDNFLVNSLIKSVIIVLHFVVLITFTILLTWLVCAVKWAKCSYTYQL